jgi:heptosyltransferase-2
MVMAQALFKYLKASDPDREVDVLAPSWSLPVVARMPEVRDGIAADTGHGELGLGKRVRLGRRLRGRYDRAIVLPRSLKSALVPWFAKVPRRTGYRGESRYGLINDMRPFDPDVLDQTVKRYVALATDVGGEVPDVPYPSLRVSATNQADALARLGLETNRPAIAFMPGAEYGPAKCWPIGHFAQLARSLDEEGYAVWVLGSQKDAAAGEAIASASHAVNVCGRTSLEDVIDVLGYAEQAVSNDSGLMHVAAAVGTFVHAIYGSSSPRFTPPLTDRRHVHWLELDCSPCFERECPLGHLRCLKEIEPALVLANIRAAR